MTKVRGYFGIGIFDGKFPENLGGLWRSAHAFGADFIFTIGARYQRRHSADTTYAARHIPLWEFPDWNAFREMCPSESKIVGIELHEQAKDLPTFCHPQSAIYVLGAEDHGLPEITMMNCDHILQIPSTLCLNVATTGSIVLYDRVAKNSINKSVR
jgi:tRNA G18 (ribose-2'-O)-methylase SpoU